MRLVFIGNVTIKENFSLFYATTFAWKTYFVIFVGPVVVILSYYEGKGKKNKKIKFIRSIKTYAKLTKANFSLIGNNVNLFTIPVCLLILTIY